MKKILGLSLATLLGCSIGTTDIAFAQAKYAPVRFGEKREYAYELSQNRLNETTLKREANQRMGQVWGKFYLIRENEALQVWGFLRNGVHFEARIEEHGESLHLDGNFDFSGSYVMLRRYHSSDYAEINGERFHLGENFYEKGLSDKQLVEPIERRQLLQKLREIYLKYNSLLNFPDLKSKAREILEAERPQPEQQLKTLDGLLK